MPDNKPFSDSFALSFPGMLMPSDIPLPGPLPGQL